MAKIGSVYGMSFALAFTLLVTPAPAGADTPPAEHFGIKLPECHSDEAQMDIKRTYEDATPNVKLLELDDAFEVYFNSAEGRRACLGTAVFNVGEKTIYFDFSPSKRDPSQIILSVDQAGFGLAGHTPDKNISSEEMGALTGKWDGVGPEGKLIQLTIADKYATMKYFFNDAEHRDTYRILSVSPHLVLGFRHADGKYNMSCNVKLGARDVEHYGAARYTSSELYEYKDCPGLSTMSFQQEGGKLVHSNFFTGAAEEVFTKQAEVMNKGKIVAALKAGAERGDATAQYRLGTMYQYGEGVSKDISQAVKLFQSAAEKGNPDAQYSLGHLYEHGDGVPQDYAEARKWFRKSAQNGNAMAQQALTMLPQ